MSDAVESTKNNNGNQCESSNSDGNQFHKSQKNGYAIVMAVRDIAPCFEEMLVMVNDNAFFEFARDAMPCCSENVEDLKDFIQDDDGQLSINSKSDVENWAITSMLTDVTLKQFSTIPGTGLSVNDNRSESSESNSESESENWTVSSMISDALNYPVSTLTKAAMSMLDDNSSDTGKSKPLGSNLTKEDISSNKGCLGLCVSFLSNKIWLGVFVLAGIALAAVAVLDTKFNWITAPSSKNGNMNGAISVATNFPSYYPSITPSSIDNPLDQKPFPPAYSITNIPTRSNVSSATITQNEPALPNGRQTSRPSILPSAVMPMLSLTPLLETKNPISNLKNFAQKYLLDVPPNPHAPLRKALEWAMLQTTPSSSQRIALATLYFATGGENWTDSLSFLSDDSECLWNLKYVSDVKGVTCNSEDQVESIDLSNYRLKNSIPRELQLLTELKVLTINNNVLSGTLPSQLGSLTKLIQLDVSHNSITGTIPLELVKMISLQDLNLRDNQLKGKISSEKIAFPELRSLWLDQNNLQGNFTKLCQSHENILISADCGQILCPCCKICCQGDSESSCSTQNKTL